MTQHFSPTHEQLRVINHVGPAFIVACPGAGKTRVMVERARRLLEGRQSRRGIAFLSFTVAAVSELENRLHREGILAPPAFPHFIGTFDSFLWQFLIAPFGIPGCPARPHFVHDKDKYLIRPFEKAQPLPLSCFDRTTGAVDPDEAGRLGFRGRNLKAYETAALKIRTRFRAIGALDFSDVREIALDRMRNADSSSALARALGARFRELIVDEAQDCNPADLQIITWLRSVGIPVKIVCDPDQSIYGFRGGVTDQLVTYGEEFAPDDCIHLTGNFRSSLHIVRALGALRADPKTS